MAEVVLKDITKVYDGNVTAVEKSNIHIEDKEFVVLVGPSGCGKTTTLRMIAGLEEITGGDLMIDGKRVNDVQPKDRDIAMVFQNYALYPHMSVYDNMAFGLKIRKFAKAEIERRVQEAAGILHLKELLQRKPKALSGGQRQRVALGRAIVRHPKVFLFDEPLSNLDAKLRVQMRTEISALHNRLAATMIYVTHDQIEAMTMGDKIVVMKDGHIQQIGNPMELYNTPCNRFVAAFIGSPPMNIISARVIEENGRIIVDEGGLRSTVTAEAAEKLRSYIGKEILTGLRPEDVKQGGDSEHGSIRAKAEVIEPLGAETHVYLNTGKHQFIVRLEPNAQIEVGDEVVCTPVIEKLHFFDLENELSLLHSDKAPKIE